eukprot:6098995-Amphidinium_carterae.1
MAGDKSVYMLFLGRGQRQVEKYAIQGPTPMFYTESTVVAIEMPFHVVILGRGKVGPQMMFE